MFVAGGRKATGIDAVWWGAGVRAAGRRRRDSSYIHGQRRHERRFDIALTRAVSPAVPIPVIASGGVGPLEHFAEGVIDSPGRCRACCEACFHLEPSAFAGMKEYMAAQGIPLDFNATQRQAPHSSNRRLE